MRGILSAVRALWQRPEPQRDPVTARRCTIAAAHWTARESAHRERADELWTQAQSMPPGAERDLRQTASYHTSCLAQAAYYRAGGDEHSAELWDQMAAFYAREGRVIADAIEAAHA